MLFRLSYVRVQHARLESNQRPLPSQGRTLSAELRARREQSLRQDSKPHLGRTKGACLPLTLRRLAEREPAAVQLTAKDRGEGRRECLRTLEEGVGLRGAVEVREQVRAEIEGDQGIRELADGKRPRRVFRATTLRIASSQKSTGVDPFDDTLGKLGAGEASRHHLRTTATWPDSLS